MRRRTLLVGVAALGAATAPALSQTYSTPRRGSAERKRILNAVRPQIEAETRGRVEFVVRSMRVSQGWAFAVLDPQRPGGAAIRFSDTVYADRGYMMDGLTVYALMRLRTGRWSVAAYVVGPTDVPYVTWPEDYGAPRAIFGF